MEDSLRETINEIFPQGLADVVFESHEMLNRVEFPDVEASFDELLGDIDTMHRHEFADSFRDLTERYVRSFVTMHGIRPSEDARLDVLTKISNALVDVQNYENGDEIIETAKIDGDSVEIISAILALVCELDADEIAMAIQSVEVQLIERIVELAGNDLRNENKDEFGIDEALIFCDFIASRDFFMLDIIRSGFQSGYPFETYAEVLHDVIEAMSPTVAAKNLIIAAYLSSDGRNNPLSKIRSKLDELFVDPNYALQVDVQVNELLLEYNRHVKA